jgi:hypothetical protein
MDTEKMAHYFVDEAGDPNLFGRRGKVLVGSEGCSYYFMLGLLHVEDPESLARELNGLRKDLLADPYFAGVPSMQPAEKKTAIAFHAKDDVPEVRKEVFSLLIKRNDIRFYAVVREKLKLITYVQQKNISDPNYHYNPNELYDYLVRRLFRDHLHLHDDYQVHFAKRGSSDRTSALTKALQTAQNTFAQKYNKTDPFPPIHVIPSLSRDDPSLQAVDYFLWALQRLFEQHEERFIKLIWPSVRLVIDLDDYRKAKYGKYYNEKLPLTMDEFSRRI